MPDQPIWAKLHSKALADQFIGLGWQVALALRADGDDEPYEYLLKWIGPGRAVYPDQPRSNPPADH